MKQFFESLSGFNYSFKKATSLSPRESRKRSLLSYARFSTPLGIMITAGSDSGICLLEYCDRKMLETELKQIQKYFKSPILPGTNSHIEKLQRQLTEYFKGTRKKFDLSLITPGSSFQNKVWQTLQKIPYGQTRSYKQQAITVGNVKAVRAVANANGANRISIIIPCHRVIGEDGHLTGYGGGLWRKQWLLNHEKNNNL